jgi:hypothetical protein
MSEELLSLAPDASPLVQLAVRAQHLERWKIPRSDYPHGRRGYLTWRREAAHRHGVRLSEIARRVGYNSDETARLAKLVRKAGARTDPEAQLVEDVACLVFLRHYLGEFAMRTEAAKLPNILTRTWRKMSPAARVRALELTYAPEHRALLQAAHAESGV